MQGDGRRRETAPYTGTLDHSDVRGRGTDCPASLRARIAQDPLEDSSFPSRTFQNNEALLSILITLIQDTPPPYWLGELLLPQTPETGSIKPASKAHPLPPISQEIESWRHWSGPLTPPYLPEAAPTCLGEAGHFPARGGRVVGWRG